MSMTVQQPKVGVGVACFVWKDGKFLMQQRAGSHGAGTWAVPGGHLEFGESWQQAAVREVTEETGLTISSPEFLATTNDIVIDKGRHHITIWMTSNWLSGEPHITEPDKCTAQGWFDLGSLPSPLFEPGYKNLRAAKPELFQ